MSQFVELTADKLVLNDGAARAVKVIAIGAITTRATLRSGPWDADNLAVGSLAIANDRIYLKIAAAGADADWYKVTTSNAD